MYQNPTSPSNRAVADDFYNSFHQEVASDSNQFNQYESQGNIENSTSFDAYLNPPATAPVNWNQSPIHYNANNISPSVNNLTQQTLQNNIPDTINQSYNYNDPNLESIEDSFNIDPFDETFSDNASPASPNHPLTEENAVLNAYFSKPSSKVASRVHSPKPVESMSRIKNITNEPTSLSTNVSYPSSPVLEEAFHYFNDNQNPNSSNQVPIQTPNHKPLATQQTVPPSQSQTEPIPSVNESNQPEVQITSKQEAEPNGFKPVSHLQPVEPIPVHNSSLVNEEESIINRSQLPSIISHNNSNSDQGNAAIDSMMIISKFLQVELGENFVINNFTENWKLFQEKINKQRNKIVNEPLPSSVHIIPRDSAENSNIQALQYKINQLTTDLQHQTAVTELLKTTQAEWKEKFASLEQNKETESAQLTERIQKMLDYIKQLQSQLSQTSINKPNIPNLSMSQTQIHSISTEVQSIENHNDDNRCSINKGEEPIINSHHLDWIKQALEAEQNYENQRQKWFNNEREYFTALELQRNKEFNELQVQYNNLQIQNRMEIEQNIANSKQVNNLIDESKNKLMELMQFITKQTENIQNQSFTTQSSIQTSANTIAEVEGNITTDSVNKVKNNTNNDSINSVEPGDLMNEAQSQELVTLAEKHTSQLELAIRGEGVIALNNHEEETTSNSAMKLLSLELESRDQLCLELRDSLNEAAQLLAENKLKYEKEWRELQETETNAGQQPGLLPNNTKTGLDLANTAMNAIPSGPSIQSIQALDTSNNKILSTVHHLFGALESKYDSHTQKMLESIQLAQQQTKQMLQEANVKALLQQSQELSKQLIQNNGESKLQSSWNLSAESYSEDNTTGWVKGRKKATSSTNKKASANSTLIESIRSEFALALQQFQMNNSKNNSGTGLGFLSSAVYLQSIVLIAFLVLQSTFHYSEYANFS